MTFSINNRPIGPAYPPYIIAELSANHNGSIDRAFATIVEAKRCGADAIKIQTYTPDTLTIDCNEPDFLIKGGPWDGYKLHDLYKWAHTPYEWHKPLFDFAKSQGITIFSTPFDETAVDLLENLNSPAYKIASFEIVDHALIRYVASMGKPMIMSTGMASKEEIEEAVTIAKEGGCKELVLLHCISSYPTPLPQANLRQISNIAKQFNIITGLSDHTLGTVASITAVALGACVIEKHFTLSRADKGPDCEFSLEPPELQHLCSETRDAWLALGNADFERPKVETGSKIFRRSLYFIKNLPAGHIIGPGDIRSIRPGNGLPPKHLPELLGRRLRSAVTRGTATSFDLFEG